MALITSESWGRCATSLKYETADWGRIRNTTPTATATSTTTNTTTTNNNNNTTTTTNNNNKL